MPFSHSQLLCWTDKLSRWEKIVGLIRLIRERNKYFGYPTLWRGTLGRHYKLGTTENLLRFKDRHIGERCYIIGNGPSLKYQDLRPLGNEITFGVNGIFLLEDEMGFLPNYYVVEDWLPAEDRANAINALKGPTKLFPLRLAYCLKPGKDVYYYLSQGYRYWWDPDFSTNAAACVFDSHTVLFHVLQWAFYMGFSEACLLGTDLSYDVPRSTLRNGFVLTSLEDDPNHFDRSYFGRGYRWHEPLVHAMLSSFIAADKAFKREGRRIFNVGHGGKLEVFPRVPLKEMLKKPVGKSSPTCREFTRQRAMSKLRDVPGTLADTLRNQILADRLSDLDTKE